MPRSDAKLTNDQVADVVQRAAEGQSHRSLAREYGVSHTAIDRLVRSGGYTLPTLEQRLLANAVRVDGCLLWQGYQMGNGYAQMQAGDRKRLVHRVAYEVWVGPIPDGLVIDHICPVPIPPRHCIEPTHLEPVTQAVNLERMRARLRAHGIFRHRTIRHRDPATGRILPSP